MSMGGGPSPTNPSPITSLEISAIESYSDNIAYNIFTPTSGYAGCSDMFFNTVSGELSFVATRTDHPYVNEAITTVGVNYPEWAGFIYMIPQGTEKIYFKSHNNIFNDSIITFYDSTKKSVSYAAISCDGITGRNVPLNARFFSMRFGINSATIGQIYKDKISLSFAPISEWKEPFYFSLELNIILNSLSNGICDEYLGNGKILRRAYKKILKGNENWNEWPAKPGLFGCDDINFKDYNATTKSNAYCDSLNVIDPNSQWGQSITNSFSIYNLKSHNVRVKIDGINTLTELKSYLASNPITIIGERAEPVIETIPIPVLPTKSPKTNTFIQTNLNTEVEWNILTQSDNSLQIQDMFPVGAIYITANDMNPETFLGGTWKRIAQGRALWGEGTSTDGYGNSKTFEAGSSSGAIKHYHDYGMQYGEKNGVATRYMRLKTFRSFNNGESETYSWWGPQPAGTVSMGAPNVVATGSAEYVSLSQIDAHTTPQFGENRELTLLPVPYFVVYFWQRIS